MLSITLIFLQYLIICLGLDGAHIVDDRTICSYKSKKNSLFLVSVFNWRVLRLCLIDQKTKHFSCGWSYQAMPVSIPLIGDCDWALIMDQRTPTSSRDEPVSWKRWLSVIQLLSLRHDFSFFLSPSSALFVSLDVHTVSQFDFIPLAQIFWHQSQITKDLKRLHRQDKTRSNPK